MSYDKREMERIWDNLKNYLPRKDTPLKFLYTMIWSFLIFNGCSTPTENKIFDFGLIIIGASGLLILWFKPLINGNKLLPAKCITDMALAPWCKYAKDELKIRINHSKNNLKIKDLIALLKIQKRYDDDMTQKENFIIKEEAINKIMNHT